MTELEYQTPERQNTGFITAAWISLLVLGILYCLVAFCVGAAIALIFFRVAGAIGMRPRDYLPFIIIGSVGFLFLGSGITYIWTSIRVRLRSRRAARVALVVCFLNVVITLGLCVLAIVAVSITGSADLFSLVMGVGFYLSIAIANGVVAWLQVRAIKDLPVV